LRARKAAGRAVLLAGILASAPPPLTAEPTAPTDDDASAKQFAAAIDSFNALDPQSPDTLNTRLAYANFLTKLDRGDCRAHLDEAQAQLDAAQTNPALAIALPSGLARVADIEYQLHSARASCGASPAVRDQELRAALQSAQRAVDLYRDAFDGVSMVTMQFNVSVAYHDLGDAVAAAAALRTTLDLDREYGFADDAKDNYRLLLRWSNQDAGPEQIAALMQDFPERSATLSFGWLESDATLTLQSDVSQLAGADLLHFQGSRTARRHVRKGLASWLVSCELDDPRVKLDELPTGEQWETSLASFLARMLTRFHDYRLTRNGDFDQTKGDFGFYLRTRATAKTLARDLGSLGPDSKRQSSRLARSIGAAVRDALLPGALEAQIAEDYNIETGTWIGATLEQGVWYDMTAALFLPLAPQIFLPHKIQFTYSRSVPCLPDSSKPSCIEIVLRAAPDPTVLKAGLDTLAHRSHLADGQVPRLWSATTMRLVTDPATLWTYSRETRWHVYWSNGVPGPDQTLIESEKTIVSMSAPAPLIVGEGRKTQGPTGQGLESANPP
jgi:tetratricopeptide (TPR) repeat protein